MTDSFYQRRKVFEETTDPQSLSSETIALLVDELKVSQMLIFGGSSRDIYASQTLKVILVCKGDTDEDIREYVGKFKTLFAIWDKLTTRRDELLTQVIQQAMNEIVK